MLVTRRRTGDPFVSTGLLSAHLRLDDCAEAELELLACNIEAATDLAERHTGRAFVEQEVTVIHGEPLLHLPVMPFDYAISAQVDGRPVHIDAVRINRSEGTCCCDGYDDHDAAEFELTYVPRVFSEYAAKTAVLHLAAWLYENRGDVDALTADAQSDTLMRSGAGAMLAPLRCSLAI